MTARLVIGEGAGLMVIEELESERAGGRELRGDCWIRYDRQMPANHYAG